MALTKTDPPSPTFTEDDLAYLTSLNITPMQDGSAREACGEIDLYLAPRGGACWLCESGSLPTFREGVHDHLLVLDVDQ